MRSKRRSIVLNRTQQGFTLIEILVAAAVFVTAIASFFGAARLALNSVSKASERVQAAYLLEEGMEAVRYLRDFSWLNYIDISDDKLGYELCLYLDETINPPLFSLDNPELLGLWHLDSTNWIDSSTNSNNATCSSCPTIVQSISDPKLINAASFTSSVHKLDVANAPQLNGASFTISLWLNPTSISSDKYILGNGGGWYVKTGNPGSQLQFSPGSGSVLTITNFLALGWQYVTITSNGSGSYNFYRNGELISQQAGVTIVNQPTMAIGNLPASSAAFTGSIDEVAIFGRELSRIEILDLYKGHPPCPSPKQYVDTGDGKSFKQVVIMENICRNNTTNKDDFSGAVNGYETCSTLFPDTYEDVNGKFITIKTIWGGKRENIEELKMILTNLFDEQEEIL